MTDDPPPPRLEYPRLRRGLAWAVPFGIAFYAVIAVIIVKVCS